MVSTQTNFKNKLQNVLNYFGKYKDQIACHFFLVLKKYILFVHAYFRMYILHS